MDRSRGRRHAHAGDAALLLERPPGDAPGGVAGHKGFFYHFLDLETGQRFRQAELSSADTALLLAGMLFAAEWFDGDAPAEAEIRDLARRIYARVDWRWMQPRAPLIAMGWHPERGFIASDWRGYNEGMLIYVLALGAPEHAIGAEAWAAWCASYPASWRGEGPTRHLAFAPHFGHQYSHVWIDFRGIRDAAMSAAGLDYFENSRRATFAQRAYATANPMGWEGYSADVWGLTACDGPVSARREFNGAVREFRSYSARGPIGFPDGFDDGTLAPTAAVASLPFAPEIVVPCAQALRARYGARLYGRYGFLDSFNPAFVGTTCRSTAAASIRGRAGSTATISGSTRADSRDDRQSARRTDLVAHAKLCGDPGRPATRWIRRRMAGLRAGSRLRLCRSKPTLASGRGGYRAP